MSNDVLEFLKLIITIASVSCAIYFGVRTASRNKTADDKQDATTLAEINTSLSSVKDSLVEIKSDMKGIVTENKEIRDRVVVVEQSCKSAHKRIDRLEGVKDDGK